MLCCYSRSELGELISFFLSLLGLKSGLEISKVEEMELVKIKTKISTSSIFKNTRF